MDTPRSEYPRPQFVRDRWINLNGKWSFAFDFGRSGHARGYPKAHSFDREILVPFCPECELSGVHHYDFINIAWYQRTIQVPESWLGSKILLHFGGCDYETEVFVDGVSMGKHWGGSSSFWIDITSAIPDTAAHNLVVSAADDLRSGAQLCGKQCLEYDSEGCFYSRTTGIWQTVWLEAVPPQGLQSSALSVLFDQNLLVVNPWFFRGPHAAALELRVLDQGSLITEARVPANGARAVMHLDSFRPWSPESPHLYDLEYRVIAADGAIIDRVQSYFGMRKIHCESNKLMLNNEPLYLRMVLDQGFYPESLWTAPTDEALRQDIEHGLAAGFNGARLHQKIFEPRYHYWADRLGYLTWEEAPSWGLNVANESGARNYLAEWREIVLRDRDHPSIIAWTTFNETWDISARERHRRLHLDAYYLTRALDPTRPVNNASGGCQVETDLYTVHIYEQDPGALRDTLALGKHGEVFRTLGDREAPYEGQPYFVDEFGGIRWTPDVLRLADHAWGYGSTPRSIDEFYSRLEGQVDAILAHPHIGGYCYTQLTDVEQEQNGLLFYDRTPKFETSRLRRIFSKTPSSL